MSKLWIALLAAAIVLTPTVSARAFDPGPPVPAAPAPAVPLADASNPPEPVDPVYAWLKAQQNPTTGLLPDQQNDLSKLYTQALAAMAFTAWGDTFSLRDFPRHARYPTCRYPFRPHAPSTSGLTRARGT